MVHSPTSFIVRGKFNVRLVPTILSLINNMRIANLVYEYIPTARRNTVRSEQRWKDNNIPCRRNENGMPYTLFVMMTVPTVGSSVDTSTLNWHVSKGYQTQYHLNLGRVGGLDAKNKWQENREVVVTDLKIPSLLLPGSNQGKPREMC